MIVHFVVEVDYRFFFAKRLPLLIEMPSHVDGDEKL